MATGSAPPTISPRTPEILLDAGPPQLDEDIPSQLDSDIDMAPEVPYDASPRQLLIDQYWDTQDNLNVNNKKEDSPWANEATSHAENDNVDKDPDLPGASV